jgi:protein phosphatase
MVVEQLKQQYNFSFDRISIKGDRSVNEDRIHVVNGGDWQLLLLADGMGGYSNGDIAAELAIQSIEKRFRQSVGEAVDNLNEVFSEANDLINEKVPGAGATLGGVFVRGNNVNIFWAGDVRIYISELGGAKSQFVTKDHNLAQLMEDSKVIINPSEMDRLRSTVTRCLGGGSSNFLPDSVYLNLTSDFGGLICSDGVHNHFASNEIFESLNKTNNKSIIGLLDKRLSKRAIDNASAIVFSIVRE